MTTQGPSDVANTPLMEAITFNFENRTKYYLNPVIRYDGGDPWGHEFARIDTARTWLFRIIGFATLIFILLNIYYLRRRIKKRASH